MTSGTQAQPPHLVESLTKALDKIILGIGAIGLIAMMLHISADIIGGLVFNAPIAVTSAFVTQYYMIAVAFLPLASGEWRGAHIGVDLFVTRLSKVPRRYVDLVILVVYLLVCLMLTVQSWQQAAEKISSGAFIIEQTTRLSIWPSYLVLPAAFGLLTLIVALKLWCRLLGRPEPEAPEDPDHVGASDGSSHV